MYPLPTTPLSAPHLSLQAELGGSWDNQELEVLTKGKSEEMGSLTQSSALLSLPWLWGLLHKPSPTAARPPQPCACWLGTGLGLVPALG